MSAIKGDFIGFTFGGKHSSELGINRVSNGSRYTETLLPEFSNKTVNVPGANRVDYLGMEFTQKSFPLDIAFDSVTEEQLREMKRLFSTDKPLPLVFDESPYKTWYAKAGGNPNFTYICFDEEATVEKEMILARREGKYSEEWSFPLSESFSPDKEKEIEIQLFIDSNPIIKDTVTLGNGYYAQVTKELEIQLSFEEEQNCLVFWMSQLNYDISLKVTTTTIANILKRCYKGEGKIDLVSFYPYAFCDPNYVANLTSENTPDNLYEWLGTSGLSETQLETNEIYNPGDFDTPFWIKIPSKTLPAGAVEFGKNTLIWSASGKIEDGLPEDNYIIIDGRNQLIEGYSADGVKTGRIYNKFITDGNWFNIPKDQEKHSMNGLRKNWELNYKILYI